MDSQFMTVKEVAEWLMFTPQTIRNHCKQGKIPFKIIDGEPRFSKEEVLKNMVRYDIDPKWLKQREEQEERSFRKMKLLDLRTHFHCLVRYSLVKNLKGRSWEAVVGYGLETLKRRLKSTIPNGHVWQDFLEGRLHLDHIVPGCAFNIDSIDSLEFKRCWALKNLQLLPAPEHREKGRKVLQPFQMGLNLKGGINERDRRALS